MTLRHTLLALGALAALALPSAAQDTTAPATPAPPATTATETPAAPAAPPAPDSAFPIAEAEQPREVLKAKNEDWEVRCAAQDESRCFIYQLVKDAEGRPLAEFTLIRLPDGGQAAAGATVVTSLGVLLTKGVVLTIDSGQPLGYPFLYCAPTGCFSRLGLTGATITRMKKGAIAKITVFGVNAPDKAVAGTLSLKGFTASYDALVPPPK